MPEKEPLPTEPDQSFLSKMEAARDGANVHSVNKAMHYYAEGFRQKKPHISVEIERLCRASIASGDWNPASDRLARYW